MITGALNETKENVRERWKLIRLVPQDASVVASFPFLTPLSQRKNLYAFYKIYDPKYQNARYSYQLPADVQYALIDTRDPWFLQEGNFKLANERAKNFLNSGHWVILKGYERYVLYKRKVI